MKPSTSVSATIGRNMQDSRLLQDFIIPSLRDGTFGDYLKWDPTDDRVFMLRWIHKGKPSWSEQDAAVALAWERLKRRPSPKKGLDFVSAKKRLRSALRQVKEIKELNEFKDYKRFKILLTLDDTEHSVDKRKKGLKRSKIQTVDLKPEKKVKKNKSISQINIVGEHMKSNISSKPTKESKGKSKIQTVDLKPEFKVENNEPLMQIKKVAQHIYPEPPVLMKMVDNTPMQKDETKPEVGEMTNRAFIIPEDSDESDIYPEPPVLMKMVDYTPMQKDATKPEVGEMTNRAFIIPEDRDESDIYPEPPVLMKMVDNTPMQKDATKPEVGEMTNRAFIIPEDRDESDIYPEQPVLMKMVDNTPMQKDATKPEVGEMTNRAFIIPELKTERKVYSFRNRPVYCHGSESEDLDELEVLDESEDRDGSEIQNEEKLNAIHKAEMDMIKLEDLDESDDFDESEIQNEGKLNTIYKAEMDMIKTFEPKQSKGETKYYCQKLESNVESILNFLKQKEILYNKYKLNPVHTTEIDMIKVESKHPKCECEYYCEQLESINRMPENTKETFKTYVLKKPENLKKRAILNSMKTKSNSAQSVNSVHDLTIQGETKYCCQEQESNVSGILKNKKEILYNKYKLNPVHTTEIDMIKVESKHPKCECEYYLEQLESLNRIPENTKETFEANALKKLESLENPAILNSMKTKSNSAQSVSSVHDLTIHTNEIATEQKVTTSKAAVVPPINAEPVDMSEIIYINGKSDVPVFVDQLAMVEENDNLLDEEDSFPVENVAGVWDLLIENCPEYQSFQQQGALGDEGFLTVPSFLQNKGDHLTLH